VKEKNGMEPAELIPIHPVLCIDPRESIGRAGCQKISTDKKSRDNDTRRAAHGFGPSVAMYDKTGLIDDREHANPHDKPEDRGNWGPG
jgi:hypothetical protein